jgi:hypothetical protein
VILAEMAAGLFADGKRYFRIILDSQAEALGNRLQKVSIARGALGIELEIFTRPSFSMRFLPSCQIGR